MQRSADRATYAAFAGAVLIGGSNFIAVSVSNQELPPLFGATVRFALGTLLLLLIARVTRVPLARGRSAAGAVLYGLFGFGAAYALLYYSLVGLNAGTAAVVVAAAPLFTLVIAVLLGQERFTRRGVAGGFLAIAGIAVLSPDTADGALVSAYFVAAVGGSIAIAVSSVVAKSFADVHPLSMNTIGMAAGTALLAIGSLALRESWTLPRSAPTIAAVAWLAILGSVGLFQLYLYVIRRWTASATVYALAGMPVVAMILGAVLLDQPITLQVVAGGTMVVAAIYVGAISATRRSQDERPSDVTGSAARQPVNVAPSSPPSLDDST